MPSRITRDQMIEAIRELPADASIDDAIERLMLLAKIEEGLAQLDSDRVTAKMNRVVQKLGEPGTDRFVATAARRVLKGVEW